MRKLDVKQLDMDPEVSTTSILDFQLMLPVLSHASKVAHYCVFYLRHKWLLRRGCVHVNACHNPTPYVCRFIIVVHMTMRAQPPLILNSAGLVILLCFIAL